MKTKLFWVATSLLVLSGLSYASELLFYDQVIDGVLQESFFLPMASILFISGIVCMGTCLLQAKRLSYKKSVKEN